jgi:hypothetical protein
VHRQLVTAAVWLGALVSTARAQEAERLAVGDGTVLVVADSVTGLDVWAARRTGPGQPRAPDFVGWFDPRLVLAWLESARNLILAPPPDSAGLETHPLRATDGGFITVAVLSESVDTMHPILLTFGHARERARWILPSDREQVPLLLSALERQAHRSRLQPAPDVAYVNPTNRAATPDRDPASVPPAFPRELMAQGIGGEVWARFDIDREGRVSPASLRILWSDRSELADAVRGVVASYRYQRRADAHSPLTLRVYQRFRFTARQGTSEQLLEHHGATEDTEAARNTVSVPARQIRAVSVSSVFPW